MKPLYLLSILMCALTSCREAPPSAPAPKPEPEPIPFNSAFFSDVANLSLSHLPTHTTPDGIRYKVVKIEGRRFIATTDFRGTWHLTGPID